MGQTRPLFIFTVTSIWILSTIALATPFYNMVWSILLLQNGQKLPYPELFTNQICHLNKIWSISFVMVIVHSRSCPWSGESSSTSTALAAGRCCDVVWPRLLSAVFAASLHKTKQALSSHERSLQHLQRQATSQKTYYKTVMEENEAGEIEAVRVAVAKALAQSLDRFFAKAPASFEEAWGLI